ncbi:zinc finger (ubiquitin-hydrolase) domain-containing protein [Artemisia annua]|uniref:Zinc finger (Ubiquitin-hydrolase) domain-containing protein n=1 Tax=Artemisia annua TaxID=35608 RepID=A0A2U1NFG2_ARTAN|nr:zinc finger (ubiquitin-hydrolase) domain-containing protein [Artemisia annua]
MFTLKIHTVDQTQHQQPSSSSSNPNTKSKKKLFNPTEIKGVVHLFRNLPLTTSSSSTSSVNPVLTLWNVATRTTNVFIVAVPNYLSYDEFLVFCGRHVDEFQDLCFIRNDAVEDRYSVLIKLKNQAAADGFCICYHGKRFSPSETQVCHIYFAQAVEYTDSAEIASIPQTGYTELPTCPVCLERLDYDTSAIQITHCDHSFQCPCITKWAYLSCQVCQLCLQQDGKPTTCAVCGTSNNPWVCLICGFVGCGRYEKGHAIQHYRHADHCYSLELETQQIWDYVGDKYVHRLNQSKVGSKSTVTHHQCVSSEGECGDKEDEEFGGALFSSKVDTIMDEYNFLLANQMETQRQTYEILLAEAKSRKEISIAEAIVKAEAERTQELQNKLEELAKDTKTVSNINEELAKAQEFLKKTYKEIQERETASLKLKDEKIMDLEEQIRDLRIYMEAQKTLANTDDIKGGTLLPVQLNPTSPQKNSKRRARKRN